MINEKLGLCSACEFKKVITCDILRQVQMANENKREEQAEQWQTTMGLRACTHQAYIAEMFGLAPQREKNGADKSQQEDEDPDIVEPKRKINTMSGLGEFAEEYIKRVSLSADQRCILEMTVSIRADYDKKELNETEKNDLVDLINMVTIDGMASKEVREAIQEYVKLMYCWKQGNLPDQELTKEQQQELFAITGEGQVPESDWIIQDIVKDLL